MFCIILVKQPSHSKVRETIAFLHCSGQTTISYSSFWLGLLGGDWFYLSCGDPKFILIGLVKLLVSIIGALFMCSDWYEYMIIALFRLFNNSKLNAISPPNIASLLSGFTSALEARWSTLAPLVSLSVSVSSFLPMTY